MPSPRQPHAGTIVPTLCSLAVLAGCSERGIEETEVARDHTPADDAPASGGPAGDATPDTASAPPDAPWTVPDGWTLDPEPRSMRIATYLAPDPDGPVEVAITRFGGRVGGELANINRWRGQIGLPPLAPEALDDAITRFASPGFEGYEARIDATERVLLAAGVYDASIDQTWFVRATVANADVADRVQAGVFAVARSIAPAPSGG